MFQLNNLALIDFLELVNSSMYGLVQKFIKNYICTQCFINDLYNELANNLI